MKPSAFLTGLWGRSIDPRLRIQLWSLADRRTYAIQAPDAADYFAGGRTDVYTCVALCDKNFKGRRPTAADARAIAGLWLDIDVDWPGAKTPGVPTNTDAVRLAHHLVEPTVMVWTGHGLHAWYVFDEPWLFYRVEDQQAAALASAQWFALHRAETASRAWGLDSAHDLARLMRMPGTINGKGDDSRAVVVDDHRGPRYARADLLALCATAGPVELPSERVAPGAVGDIHAGGKVDLAPLDALIANDPAFSLVFFHADGRHGWSLSEYDMSIATTLARAGGWTNQQIADVLVAHRAHHGEHAKGRRVDYLRRTIAKARANASRTDAQTTLDELAGRKAA